MGVGRLSFGRAYFLGGGDVAKVSDRWDYVDDKQVLWDTLKRKTWKNKSFVWKGRRQEKKKCIFAYYQQTKIGGYVFL